MEFDKVIEKRASIRKYSDKSVNLQKVMECIDCANTAPSPGNLPILKYIVIEDKEKIIQIAKACQQDFISNSQVIVVLCSNKESANTMYYERANNYVQQHVGAATENFLLKLTDLGLAGCWVGAFSDVTIKNIIKIPDNIEAEVIIPIAYQHKTSLEKQKKKNNIDNIVYFEKWGDKEKLHDPKIKRSSV